VTEQNANVSHSYTLYRSGSLFAGNRLFGAEINSLQIGMYNDDFETVHPLGTSKGLYKLSAFYWMTANLPITTHNEAVMFLLALWTLIKRLIMLITGYCSASCLTI